ncbi:hypothetical protein BJY04DRAFT_229295 [Aspergillus karnatakaensis]|uniref:uncharacterized protein n=1 Tax=Aspergillus karnatakaensis TaxID=1810916 RepID=UPI003CCCBECF
MVSTIEKAFRFLRAFKQRRGGCKRLSFEQNPPWSMLLELPVDILVLIISHLLLAYLYRLLSLALDDDRLAWPKLLAHTFPRIEPIGSLRSELLLKLENARWFYCEDCLKLYPHDRFGFYVLGKPSSQSFNSPVGVLDLCACLALTYADGVRLAAWIQTGVPSHTLPRNIRQEFQLQLLDNKRVLIHTCSVKSQPDNFVALATRLSLDANDDSLIATTSYRVYWSTPHTIFPTLNASSEVYRPPHDTNPYSFACGTLFRLLSDTDNGLHAVIQAERNLGVMQNNTHMQRLAMKFYNPWREKSRQPWNATQGMWYSRH